MHYIFVCVCKRNVFHYAANNSNKFGTHIHTYVYTWKYMYASELTRVHVLKISCRYF